jgi:glycyl-tRNA synthetase beta chain
LTPVDIDRRVHAIDFFRQLPAAQALAAANKRVSNIIVKQSQTISNEVDQTLLQESAEIALAQALAEQTERVMPLFATRQYKEALTSLATLRDVVDDFFDSVMVMTDDQPLRCNRLALLQQLRELFLHVADVSYLAVK